MKAIWNNQVIAESNKTVVVEGNHYFPMVAVNEEYLNETDTHTICPWKGTASYFDITINGKTNSDAAWTYKNPKDAASKIKNYVAFWKGVEVVE
ncbi:DUF427 domain-containing protein [Saccharicrinis sp. FJH54]|uniref:DUF427 domain-containing protein n=1 Tax=Saccharicrinis sp. FJH54 TaxID=3344665 RepID=UPI0035D48155